jgi:hypothetical protein
VSSSLTMDPGLDPLKLARQMQNLQAGNFSFTTIPTKGFADTPVGNVVVVDTATMPDFIDSLIGTDAASALAAAKAAPASSFAVDVWNGSGVNLRATKNAEALRALGFTTNVPQGNPDQLAATTIRYAPGMEGAAKTLAAQIPGAQIVRSRAVQNVTLILGANGVQVKSLMPVASSTPPTSTPPSQGSSSAPSVTTAAAAGCIN